MRRRRGEVVVIGEERIDEEELGVERPAADVCREPEPALDAPAVTAARVAEPGRADAAMREGKRPRLPLGGRRWAVRGGAIASVVIVGMVMVSSLLRGGEEDRRAPTVAQIPGEPSRVDPLLREPKASPDRERPRGAASSVPETAEGEPERREHSQRDEGDDATPAVPPAATASSEVDANAAAPAAAPAAESAPAPAPSSSPGPAPAPTSEGDADGDRERLRGPPGVRAVSGESPVSERVRTFRRSARLERARARAPRVLFVAVTALLVAPGSARADRTGSAGAGTDGRDRPRPRARRLRAALHSRLPGLGLAQPRPRASARCAPSCPTTWRATPGSPRRAARRRSSGPRWPRTRRRSPAGA